MGRAFRDENPRSGSTDWRSQSGRRRNDGGVYPERPLGASQSRPVRHYFKKPSSTGWFFYGKNFQGREPARRFDRLAQPIRAPEERRRGSLRAPLGASQSRPVRHILKSHPLGWFFYGKSFQGREPAKRFDRLAQPIRAPEEQRRDFPRAPLGASQSAPVLVPVDIAAPSWAWVARVTVRTVRVFLSCCC